jgi:signal transduction histidine kinase
VHRIVGEALANARRHAVDATRVSVSVTRTLAGVRVLVRDDGVPRRTGRPRPAGYGLTGMAERAYGLGGTFAAGPDPAGGWRVEAELPVERSDA